MRIFLSITIFLSISISAVAQPPDNYYNSTDGKYEQELLEELHNIIKDHNVISYAAIWSAITETDATSTGKVWDMYSNCTFTFGDDQDSGTGGTSECEFYNREHSFPKSWFGDGSPMYTDLFHVYPTDKKVNSIRGNYPYGEVGSATYTSNNGSKLGNSSYSGYSGTVFEPIDEYKGDFARTYFYMAARYYDQIHNWSSDMLNGTQYPAFSEWTIDMLIEWHEQDPVSDKEINRNNAIYNDYQGNRNPFIDNPEFVYRVWGEETSYVVTYGVDGENGTLEARVDGTIVESGGLVIQGSNIQFTTTPDDGYGVKSWTVNGDIVSDYTDIEYLYENIQEPLTVTVEFESINNVTAEALSNPTVYPNPFTNSITLTNAENFKRMVITNLVGQKVMDIKLEGEAEINTSALSKGVYFFTFITNSDETLVKKMIKQ
ncbi:MAG: endonuclease [Bacteroidales bacterium]